MDILDNNSSYILKEELLPKQLSIQNQSLRHSDYQKLYNHEFTNPIIHYFNQCFQSKNTVIAFIYPAIQKLTFIIKIRMVV